MAKFGGDEVGWGKVACWSTKAAMSLKRVKIDKKLPHRVRGHSSIILQLITGRQG